ncbi:unnamed protein product [Clonostachys rosea f. rosea IK726]|uniref:Uncharacterized protein n=2 Tax=Bionectria ochroleuca TaxID=29856 RepID=A0A0B7KNC1_BIOOC|nr:unnamed protein product [Clonostachys rosea f. rosea IK726]
MTQSGGTLPLSVDHEDHAASPHIQSTAVELVVHESLGRNIWLRTTDSRYHMGLLFPPQTDTLAAIKVANLEHAVLSKEKILGFEVAVDDTHLVQILDPHQ